MDDTIYTHRQTVEIFHIEFLRQFSGKVDASYYALKGGVNLRLFLQSVRYSEDMDIDVNRERVSVDKLKKIVMGILVAPGFMSILKTFAIDSSVLLDMETAKQTQITQRFKIHLKTQSGIDLPTKIEFSGRGFMGNVVIEQVKQQILRFYKMPSMVVPHYEVSSAVAQKINVLAKRTELQARDIFDLYLLSSQYSDKSDKAFKLKEETIKTAHENIFRVGYVQFRDTVVNYLGPEDQKIYDSERIWDEIQLKTANFLEEYKNGSN
ncbi:MAG TPA: nucleotidyl transferase AbiEii/AbiGii toxin family protein [Candidatus Omnitrophota bacterium]|nr:nucleotidyl transferase AbiEii/AbiGii toxin family protein [Candidatus Omnitrophota bacterium]